MRRYPPSTVYKYLDLPSTQRIRTHKGHRQNATPPLKTLVKSPTDHPATPPTPPQPKHIHTPYTLPGLVKPDPILSSARAKHMHISHTLQTLLIPRTTLIPNMSDALYTILEPCAPSTCTALSTTTPPPSPTPAFPFPSHPHTLSSYTHASQTTVHVSQLQQPPYPHRAPQQPHRQTKWLQTLRKHIDPAVKVKEIASYFRST